MRATCYATALDRAIVDIGRWTCPEDAASDKMIALDLVASTTLHSDSGLASWTWPRDTLPALASLSGCALVRAPAT